MAVSDVYFTILPRERVCFVFECPSFPLRELRTFALFELPVLVKLIRITRGTYLLE